VYSNKVDQIMQATEQSHKPIAVIDAKPEQATRAELLDVIAELRGIIKDAIATLS
jgi:hypothetical protein